MTLTTLEPILREHPLLEGLPDDYIALLVGCASNVRFEAGQVIAHHDDPSNHFYLIRHGDVALEVNAPARGPLVVATVHAGDIVGWSWLVPPHRWAFDVRATTLTRAIAFDAACLRTKCAENHDLGYELLRRVTLVMSDRLKAARVQLLELCGGP